MDCQHKWVIETTEDYMAMGVCSKCNAVRFFENKIKDVYDKVIIAKDRGDIPRNNLWRWIYARKS